MSVFTSLSSLNISQDNQSVLPPRQVPNGTRKRRPSSLPELPTKRPCIAPSEQILSLLTCETARSIHSAFSQGELLYGFRKTHLIFTSVKDLTRVSYLRPFMLSISQWRSTGELWTTLTPLWHIMAKLCIMKIPVLYRARHSLSFGLSY